MPNERMSIKDYLALMRETGQTPAFTNIAGQTGQFGSERAYVIPEYQIAEEPTAIHDPMRGGPAGRYLEPGPAMPPREPEPEQREIDEGDPWDMANAALPAMLDELRSEMFPMKRPGDKLTSQEWQRFTSGAKSIRNALVDRFKWQIDRRDKIAKQKAEERQKAGISQKQIIDLATSLAKNYDPMNLEGEGQTQYIKRMVDEIFTMATELAPGKREPEPGVLPGREEEAPAGRMTVEQAKRQGMQIRRIGKYQGKNVVQIGDNYFLEDPVTKTLSPVNIIR